MVRTPCDAGGNHAAAAGNPPIQPRGSRECSVDAAEIPTFRTTGPAARSVLNSAWHAPHCTCSVVNSAGPRRAALWLHGAAAGALRIRRRTSSLCSADASAAGVLRRMPQVAASRRQSFLLLRPRRRDHAHGCAGHDRQREHRAERNGFSGRCERANGRVRPRSGNNGGPDPHAIAFHALLRLPYLTAPSLASTDARSRNPNLAGGVSGAAVEASGLARFIP